MTMDTPSVARLAAIAARFHLHLDDADLASFQALVEANLASYERVDELVEPTPVDTSRESGSSPSGTDNPLGAWAVRGSIRGAGSGPLAGKRVVIKDNVAVAGWPMRNGSHSMEGYVPAADATVVRRLLDAGAEIVGKSVCEDLCFSGASHTSASGPVHNPWATDRTSGGSSSGSAALVATGEVDLAIGGDQGGSVRIPSSFCGTVGHKPTWGLVPYTGAFPIEATVDHLGPIGPSVAAVAEMLGVIAGADGRDPRQHPGIAGQDYAAGLTPDLAGVRVAIVTEGFGWPDLSDPDVDDAVRRAALRLAEAGATVSEVSIPWHRDGLHIWNVIATEGATTQMLELNSAGMNVRGHYDVELLEFFAAARRERADLLAETVKLVALTGAHTIDAYGGAYYAKAQNLGVRLTEAYDAALEHADVLVMPTTPMSAPPLAPADAPREEVIARAFEMIPNTAPFDVTGHPALSVPVDQVGGMPAGMMIVARRFDDLTALRVGHVHELLTGGFPKAPSRAQA